MRSFEHMRYLARWNGDDDALLHETARCLADFDDDPAGMMVACRRLLAHHPTIGALWWLCARVCCAADPACAADEAAGMLDHDATAGRLAGALPFPHDDPVAVLGWPDTIAVALADRPDLDVVAVARRRGDAPLVLRLRHHVSGVRVVNEPQLHAMQPSHLLIETVASSPESALVPSGARELAGAAGAAGAEIWLVAAVGRVLPGRLFGAVTARTAEVDDAWETMPVTAFDRAALPSGPADPSALRGAVDCPVAPELLRFS